LGQCEAVDQVATEWRPVVVHHRHREVAHLERHAVAADQHLEGVQPEHHREDGLVAGKLDGVLENQTTDTPRHGNLRYPVKLRQPSCGKWPLPRRRSPEYRSSATAAAPTCRRVWRP